MLQGRFAPTVRHLLATLGSGRTVPGMADVVVLNDPITAQGSNDAAACAAICLNGIIEHGDGGYDAAFKQGLFAAYGDDSPQVAGWANAMLSPPPEPVPQMLGAAQENPQIAQRFANGFDDPPDFTQWLMPPDAAEDYLGSFNPVH